MSLKDNFMQNVILGVSKLESVTLRRRSPSITGAQVGEFDLMQKPLKLMSL